MFSFSDPALLAQLTQLTQRLDSIQSKMDQQAKADSVRRHFGQSKRVAAEQRDQIRNDRATEDAHVFEHFAQ